MESSAEKTSFGPVSSERAKIAFFCGGDGQTFLGDIYNFVRERFEVRLFNGSTAQEVYNLMQWSDISWFEWCTNLAEIGSKLPKVCKNIVRLHRYEAYLDWPVKVNWANVDVLIAVGNSFVMKALTGQAPDIESSTKVVRIPSGIDTERIRYAGRSAGKKIAFVGNLRMVKNPMFLLHCMYKLHKINLDYRLYFAGGFQDGTLEQYMYYSIRRLGLEDVVIFDGWQGNVPQWLEDKHYIVATSIIESQGMGILEGMAGGLKPVIHNFPGAEEIFDRRFLFDTDEEFCSQILSADYRSSLYRGFVEQKYSLRLQLLRINEVLTALLEQVKRTDSAFSCVR